MTHSLWHHKMPVGGGLLPMAVSQLQISRLTRHYRDQPSHI